eukprot:1628211-Pyramimonas_sp.AAC.1
MLAHGRRGRASASRSGALDPCPAALGTAPATSSSLREGSELEGTRGEQGLERPLTRSSTADPKRQEQLLRH